MSLDLSNTQYVVLSLCVAAMLGCGSAPEGASVTGTVTLDSEPISEATIVFRPMDQGTGKSTEGQVVAGKFDVHQETGVFGTHRVEILAYRPTGVVAEQQSPLPPGQQPPATTEQYLPESYNRYSQLTFDIQPGKNQAEFELFSRP